MAEAAIFRMDTAPTQIPNAGRHRKGFNTTNRTKLCPKNYVIIRIGHGIEAVYCVLYLLYLITGHQINLYLEQPMEIQLFATFFQRRK
jgi:transketolase N-terminal domain/subunit